MLAVIACLSLPEAWGQCLADKHSGWNAEDKERQADRLNVC